MTKTEQLQLRVSSAQKDRIKAMAAMAGEDVSKWVLKRLLPPLADVFQKLIQALQSQQSARSLVVADVHDFLTPLTAQELELATQSADLQGLGSFEANYLAAMVEYACTNRRAQIPEWTHKVAPLERPWFASDLKSLRLHLLTSSPPPFRKRNLFIDSSLGDRV